MSIYWKISLIAFGIYLALTIAQKVMAARDAKRRNDAPQTPSERPQNVPSLEDIPISKVDVNEN